MKTPSLAITLMMVAFVPALAQPPGGPFTATENVQITQTKSDGTIVTGPVDRIRFYRDSSGRTRTELRPEMNSEFMQPGPPENIDVIDSVAGFRYFMDAKTTTARRYPFPKASPNAPAFPEPGESLGTRVIEGLVCDGYRNVSIYPASTVGMDHDVVVQTEKWVSRELGIWAVWKITDPRIGVHVTWFSNIIRAEPDPTLFVVPADYTITN